MSPRAPLPISILAQFQSDFPPPSRNPIETGRKQLTDLFSIIYGSPSHPNPLALLLLYYQPWARFEWMDRLRVTKRGGRGLLVTTDDSFPTCL